MWENTGAGEWSRVEWVTLPSGAVVSAREREIVVRGRATRPAGGRGEDGRGGTVGEF